MRTKRVVLPDAAQSLQMLDRCQVALMLGMSEWTVRQWHRNRKFEFPEGTLLSRRLGYRWTVAQIRQFQRRLKELRRHQPMVEE